MEQPNEDFSKPMEEESAKTVRKKLRRCQQSAAAAASSQEEEEDRLGGNYGDAPLIELQSADLSLWTTIGDLNQELKDKAVIIRGRAHTTRVVSKKTVFLVIRSPEGFTVQCVVVVQDGLVSDRMVKFVAGISRESVVQVRGLVSIPSAPIKGSSQEVEIQVRQVYCIARNTATLPINIDDAARSEKEIEEGKYVRVNQDTRLNHRVLDLGTPANHGIFRIQSKIKSIFSDLLKSQGFIEISTPEILEGSSEGDSAVFKLDYFGQTACLAQSPQLHKQMAICGDLGRVFVVGSVFRAEASKTHRHLCEFVSLDVEMEIKTHYSEVMDLVDRLFVAIFDHLNETCKKELEAVRRQYPFEPLKYLRKTLRLRFEQGIQMLKEAGVEVDPYGDLNTEAERKLGQLVLEKYGTEFYILHRYPLAVRPFYTMPAYDDPNYSNSFAVFIRGEEIISGSQRIHVLELLEERAKKCGVDVNTITDYIDAFRYGAPPHGGFGAGLERVVMLFLALNNICKTSLFPRDPQVLLC